MNFIKNQKDGWNMGLVYVNKETKEVLTPRIEYDRKLVLNLEVQEARVTRARRYTTMKKRYLQMLQNTIKEPQSLSEEEELEQTLSTLASNPDVWRDVQSEYARLFNEAAQKSNVAAMLSDEGVVQALYQKRGKGKTNRDEFLAYLDELLLIVDGEKSGIGAWKGLKTSKKKPQFLSMEDITLLKRAQSLLAPYLGRDVKSKDIPLGTVNALTTDVSEYMSAAIAYACKFGIEECDELLSNPSMLKKLTKENVRFTGAEIKKGDLEDKVFSGIKSKAADSIQRTKVSYNKTFKSKTKGESEINVDFAFDLGLSTKAYVSAQDKHSIKMVSYSGKNSPLLPMLSSIYGARWQRDERKSYTIYNALAFKYEEGREDIVARNYRIIRSDLIGAFAENYLVGVDSSVTQSLLVYNYTAYPIIGIIDAIVDEMNKAKKDNRAYGSISNDLFSIRLNTTAAYANKWLDQETDPPDTHLACKRIRKVMAAVAKMQTYGQINYRVLEAPEMRKYFKPSNGVRISFE